jgi:haloalkane dehalogenase
MLAPDLIGMGKSGKPDIAYRFVDHARYLDAWFDALALDDVVLVGHDWGGALALHWASRHADRLSGVVLMETILRPLRWSAFPPPTRAFFEELRTPGRGEPLVLEQNLFLERALPQTVMSGLAPADLDVYRAPYPTPASRRPLLEWPRQLPIDGQPEDVVTIVEDYDRWLASAPDLPKLLLTFDAGPGAGALVGPEVIAWCREHLDNLEVVGCGPAGHHCPEDQPDAIAAAIRSWLDRHGLRARTSTSVLPSRP